MVYDTTYPDNVGSGTVTITVQRNPNAPQFQGDNYQRTIDEKIGLGASVLQLAARDQDGVGLLKTCSLRKLAWAIVQMGNNYIYPLANNTCTLTQGC